MQAFAAQSRTTQQTASGGSPHFSRSPAVGAILRRAQPENAVDSRCAKKMESYIRENWLAEIKKKYEGGGIAGYDEFKNDAFARLGVRDFQSFEDGQNSFSCCSECFIVETSADPADTSNLISHGRRETLRHDKKALSESRPNAFPVIQSIVLKDGNAFAVTFGMALMPPGECFPA